jgi:polyisoprenoid-binding protein YceI
MSAVLSTAAAIATVAGLESWSLDTSHSTVGFRVRHMVVSKVSGRFTRWSGTLQLGGRNLQDSRVDVSIDVASIDTGVEKRDAHLRSPDFFDAARFPRIAFRSARVDSAGEDRYRVTGDLTIRGVTRPVALDVEFGGRTKDPWGGERVGFTARAALDRREFGLTWNQALETGGVLVGEKVEIELELEAVKQGS